MSGARKSLFGDPRTKWFYLFGFLALVVSDTLTQVSIKYAGNAAGEAEFSAAWILSIMKVAWIYIAIVGYCGSFITWMTLLRHAPIGPSFAASHIEIVSVTLLSIWLFNEPMTLYKGIGFVLIISGVLCLAKSPPSDEPHPQDEQQGAA